MDDEQNPKKNTGKGRQLNHPPLPSPPSPPSKKRKTMLANHRHRIEKSGKNSKTDQYIVDATQMSNSKIS